MSSVTRSSVAPLPEPIVLRRRRWLWLAVGVAAFAAVAWSWFPLPDAAARLAGIPRVGPGFDAADVALTPTERAAFARVNVVHRRYAFGDRIVFVTLLDGTGNRHAVHDPQFCFRGAGWEVRTRRPLTLTGGSAAWVELARGTERAQAVYWFDDGRQRYASPLRYWWATTLRRLTFGRTGDEPILLVLQAVGPDQPELEKLAPEIVRALRL